MNYSGDAAEQIVRLSLEGVEVAARITGVAAKETAMLLIAALKKNDKGSLKLKGKARLASMLKSGKALEIITIRDRDLANFAKGAKEYGIVYCALRNIKGNPDGLCDVIVKADDAPKISRLVERFKFATVDKAKVDSEIVAEKAEKTPKPKSSRAKGAEAEPEAPDVGETEKLLDDLLSDKDGKPAPDAPVTTEPSNKAPAIAGKEQADARPLAYGSPETSNPSGPTYGSRGKPERATSGKQSVKEEIREIKAARKQKETGSPMHEGRAEPGKPKTTPSTEHKQPQRGKYDNQKGIR